MSDPTRPDPATVDTLAVSLWHAGHVATRNQGHDVVAYLLRTEAPTVAAAQAATPHGRQAMLAALGLNQPRHCRNCGWDVSVHP